MGGGRYRIAIYSQDSLGLGHLRRNILIGRKILEFSPQTNVLLFTDSPASPFFTLPDGMDHIKLPSIRKLDAGQWLATKLDVASRELLRMRSELMRAALRDYHPDLFLVDHMPAGAKGELIPVLQCLKKTYPDCSILLGLRDILDEPAVIARVWKSDEGYHAIEEYYDRILIYGDREIFATAQVYDLPEPRDGIHYCGYVVNGSCMLSHLAELERDRSPSRRLVFISAGGGADGDSLMCAYAAAVRRLARRATFSTLMAVGVNAPKRVIREMQRRSEGLRMLVVSHLRQGMGAIAAADLVVSMAGYNSIAEIVKLGKKALVVPRAGPSAEQRMRAGVFAARGLVDALDPSELSAESLGERLLADLGRSDYPVPDPALDLGGASQAAKKTVELLEARPYARAL